VKIVGSDSIDCLGNHQTIPVLRIVQEALTNVVRHGVGVDTVDIAVSLTGSIVTISITDNGKEAMTLQGTSGLGMDSMRGRATSLGGVFTATATSDGFEVKIELPRKRTLDRQFAE
jgi:signal transduction histidine kinase